MRRAIKILLVTGAVAVGSVLATPAFGADNGSVAATVSVIGPCLQLEGTSVTFPQAKFSTSTTNGFTSVNGPSVTNCGSAAQITAKGTNAAGENSAAWNLTSIASKTAVCSSSGGLFGTNKFALNYYNGGAQAFLTTNATEIVSSLVSNGILSGYQFELFMPCTGSSGGGSVMSFTITFTAIVP